jgi:hypothetical protein
MVLNSSLLIDTEILLQLGKAKDDYYYLDVKYPFSLYQAFGVCLASFDFKYFSYIF